MHTRTMETEGVGKTKPQYTLNTFKRYKTLKYTTCPINFPAAHCLWVKLQTALPCKSSKQETFVTKQEPVGNKLDFHHKISASK